MTIRIIALILWLFLGVFYYSLYTNSKATCCAQEINNEHGVISSIEEDSLEGVDTISSHGIEMEADIDELAHEVETTDSSSFNDNKSEVSQSNEVSNEPEKALIFFPQNSKTRLTSETLEKYLDEISERVINSSETIKLYGHTDKLGPERKNIALGMARANTIKQLLLNRGVPSSQIETYSKGSKEPIGNNKTREGRSKNRRVELFIN